MWVIKYLDLLEKGYWPPDPQGSNYTDVVGKPVYHSEASYVKPVLIAADVNKRLAKTKVYGRWLVEAIVKDGKDLRQLGEDPRSALMYIKGNREKEETFANWRAVAKKYRNGAIDL